MKIGIDARFYGSLGKGLGRYTQKLIEHLEAIDTDNQYVVFLRRENFDEYQPKNKNFRKVLADYRWYSFSEQLFFPLLLHRFHFDVMHFPHFNVPLLYRRKFVVTIHDLILVHFSTQRSTTLHPLWYRLKFSMYKRVIRSAIQKARHILTVSEYTKQDILRHYVVDEEKITVTYEAADAFCYYTSPSRSQIIAHRYTLTSSDTQQENCAILQPYFLYVGNAYPHKNLERLVKVLSTPEGSDMKLVFVGKEDYFYRRLKEYTTTLSPNNIVFAGFVPDDELDVLYRYACAYVFPSLYEGFGLPPLEAMNKGVPVIASNAASLPEIMGDAALLFDPKNEVELFRSLRIVWDDATLRQTLRMKGYARTAQFDWRDMAKKTLACYETS